MPALNRITSAFSPVLAGLYIGGLIPFGSVQAEETVDDVMSHWTAGLQGLSEEETAFLRQLATHRVEARGERFLGGPQPGANSSLVRVPILLNLVAAFEANDKPLDDQIRNLVDQAGDSFFYFETGVSVHRDMEEDIDALIFQLDYQPDAVSTHSQIPDTEMGTLLTLGTEVELQATASLDLVPAPGAETGASGTARIRTEREFDITEVRISATGQGQPWSRWMLKVDDLVNDDVRFIIVLRVPHQIEALTFDTIASFINERYWPLTSSRLDKRGSYSCDLTSLACSYAEQ